jgi:hypothetical protein
MDYKVLSSLYIEHLKTTGKTGRKAVEKKIP